MIKKIILNNRTEFINYFYFIISKIWKIVLYLKK